MRKSPLLNGLIGTPLATTRAKFAAVLVPQGVGEGWVGEFDHAARQLLPPWSSVRDQLGHRDA
jgi:hypothetical protein